MGERFKGTARSCPACGEACKNCFLYYTPASEASREVANLTEGKNRHTPLYGVKEFVCLSFTNFDPNYLRTGRTLFYQDNNQVNLKQVIDYYLLRGTG